MKVITIVTTYVLHGNIIVSTQLATSPKNKQWKYFLSSATAVKIRVWWRVTGNGLHPFSHHAQPLGESSARHSTRNGGKCHHLSPLTDEWMHCWCGAGGGSWKTLVEHTETWLWFLWFRRAGWPRWKHSPLLHQSRMGVQGSRFTHPLHTKGDEEQVTVGELLRQGSLSPSLHQHQNHVLCSSTALTPQLFSWGHLQLKAKGS